jgi:hypothetical protein
MGKNISTNNTQKVIKKCFNAGLLIEPYSNLWLTPKLDLLFDKKILKNKDLSKNYSSYFLVCMQNKHLTEELCSLYAPLSSYFDNNYEYFKDDLLNFLLMNLQTKQILVIRVDQEGNFIETDIDYDSALMENMSLEKINSSKLKSPNYKEFLKCDFLGLINEFITLIAMISKLLGKLKQAGVKSSTNDEPVFKEITQNLDKLSAISHVLDEKTLENINRKLKELVDITDLIKASVRIIVDHDSIEKQVDILCKNESPSTLLMTLRDKLQIFFPKISYKI